MPQEQLAVFNVPGCEHRLNGEARMTSDKIMMELEWRNSTLRRRQRFEFSHSDFLRRSSFKFCHFKAQSLHFGASMNASCCRHDNRAHWVFNTSMNASWGMLILPMLFIRFFPSFCFSSSLRFRV